MIIQQTFYLSLLWFDLKSQNFAFTTDSYC